MIEYVWIVKVVVDVLVGVVEMWKVWFEYF